jgi:DNA mismatch repair protein MutS2
VRGACCDRPSPGATPLIQQQVLDKLDWALLLKEIAGHCQTDQGRVKVESLKPDLDGNQVRERWADTLSLKNLIEQGYAAPVGFIPELKGIFRALSIGQILDGNHLRDISTLLTSTKFVHGFSSDFSLKARVLEKWRAGLMPSPKLLQEIDRSVGVDGDILDDASKELDQIRRHKRHLMQRILDKIKQHLNEHKIADYLQDDFFTIRHDKYVIPIKIDGRGRVEGNIIDASSSGQTLFIEPPSISTMNLQIGEVELSERLEVIRILKDLSTKAAKELDLLRQNYDLLIELDFLSSLAKIAHHWNCEAPELTLAPVLNLYSARHPLLRPHSGPTIPNDILLSEDQKVLIVSGPNAGGKTVALKTVAIIHIMAKSGLLLPLSASSSIFLFENVFLELGDGQSLSANLSTFSSHLLGLKPIVEQCSMKDLVLLDEIAVGTEPNTGAAIAQAIVEELMVRKSICIVTTHYERLKILALNDPKLRNASMEYGMANFRPTFKLILDVPGQSYGLELAQQTGLPRHIIERANSLKGISSNQIDVAVAELSKVKLRNDQLNQELQLQILEAEATKERWDREVALLEQSRTKAVKNIAIKFENELEKHRSQIEEATENLKKVAKEVGNTNFGTQEKSSARTSLNEFKSALTSPAQVSHLPGLVAKFEDLAVGDKVFVIPLQKQGNVLKGASSPKDSYDILVGIIKVRANLDELRLIQKLSPSKITPILNRTTDAKSEFSEERKVFQTASNTCNLRGLSGDEAISRSLKFIDLLTLKGEPSAVLVHGFGTSAVKNAIRKALKNNCPYNIFSRPGFPEEGGEAVTIVFILD